MKKRLEQILKNSPNPALIEKAFEFAKAAHEGQKRYSGKGYIFHPLAVAQILSKMRLDPQTIAAGFLHDVPDDTEKTLGDISKEFGNEIAFLVEGVSKLGKLRYPKEQLDIKSAESRKEKPFDQRAENLRKMFFAMAEDVRVVLIKLADRLHNMETLNSVPPAKQQRIALETLEIFAPLANRLGMGEMKGALEDLSFPYLYPREYRWLKENIKGEYKEREKHLKNVQPLLIKILKKEGINPISVHSRPKHYWSLYQKLLKYDMNFNMIYDLIALRVIVNDVRTCYETIGAIHKQWKPLPGRIKDYISAPKPNGYQALHTTVICPCPNSEIIEIQVKTKKMHEEAELGIAAHWAMKEGIDLKARNRKFAWVGQLRNWRSKILKAEKEKTYQHPQKKLTWVQELKEWQTQVAEPEEFLEGLKIDFFRKRIFVFTPKGDVIDLPEEATPVDFAYAVHTEIGNRCSGAKVNGKMSSLSQPLKNWDMVEIIVDKNKRPSRDWLEFVKTSMARSRIKSWLKQEYGGILPKEVFKKTTKDKKPPPRQDRAESRLKLKKQTKGTRVALAGQKGMQVFLAKCCLPQPGQQVKAYITRNRGASIHKENCVNLVRAQQKWPYKVVEAAWEEE